MRLDHSSFLKERHAYLGEIRGIRSLQFCWIAGIRHREGVLRVVSVGESGDKFVLEVAPLVGVQV